MEIKSKFKVGDKVMLIIVTRNPGLKVGDTGTVVNILPYSQTADMPQYKVGVSWNVVNDKDLFHDCDGACRYGKGWYELPNI